jgi:hypothetical protein
MLRLFNRSVSIAAGVFTVIGLLMIFSACGNDPLLVRPDFLFGVTTRALLLLTGLLHLTLGGLMFAVQDSTNRGLLGLWAGSTHLVYGVGMIWLKAAVPSPAIETIGWRIGIRPVALERCWTFFLGYLLIASLLLVLAEWRRLRQLKIASFEKRWREMREQQIDLPIPSRSQKTLPAQADLAKQTSPATNGGVSEMLNQTREQKNISVTVEFKFSCPNCGQHFQCNGGYTGRQISCPGCQKQIQVPQPAGL